MKTLRVLLISLHLLVALNAFGGGYYALSGAPGVPPEWLEGSPFRSYLVPGLLLFFIIGGCCTLSSIALMRRTKNALRWSAVTGTTLLLWIIIQVLIIGYVSWLQPAIAAAALCMLLLTARLQKNA